MLNTTGTRFHMFLAHWQAHKGQMDQWPWYYKTRGLENSKELWPEKSILHFQGFVFCKNVDQLPDQLLTWLLEVAWQFHAARKAEDKRIAPVIRPKLCWKQLHFVFKCFMVKLGKYHNVFNKLWIIMLLKISWYKVLPNNQQQNTTVSDYW